MTRLKICLSIRRTYRLTIRTITVEAAAAGVAYIGRYELFQLKSEVEEERNLRLQCWHDH